MFQSNADAENPSYVYETAQERNDHIKEMCRNKYVCTHISGTEQLVAAFKLEKESI